MNQQPEVPTTDWVAEWLSTGLVRCSDCGTRVRCDNLTSLPSHHCVQRQRARTMSGARA